MMGFDMAEVGKDLIVRGMIGPLSGLRRRGAPSSRILRIHLEAWRFFHFWRARLIEAQWDPGSEAKIHKSIEVIGLGGKEAVGAGGAGGVAGSGGSSC